MPLEILVRGKDAEQNAKHFEKCLDLIKGGGVCSTQAINKKAAHVVTEKSRNNRER